MFNFLVPLDFHINVCLADAMSSLGQWMDLVQGKDSYSWYLSTGNSSTSCYGPLATLGEGGPELSYAP